VTQTILLAGATGLIGSRVATRLLKQRDLRLVSLLRAGSVGKGEPVDYERLCDAPKAMLRPLAGDRLDVGISCLGTTIRQAGSQRAMHRVDHDYVLAVAKGVRALGAKRFILMTAAGAGGPGFYLRTKGEIERAVIALGFERVDLIRPGFLLGERGTSRPVEAIGQRLFAAITPVLRGPLSRYGAIRADAVADAIVSLSAKPAPGCFTHENADLRAMASMGRLP
jgi:uncharacterized protein YbjT (DUF2867 family)